MKTFREYLEDRNEIRGEYWIANGQIDFVDGDIGDVTHEGAAINHIFYNYSHNVGDLAEEFGIDASHIENHGEPDQEAIAEVLNECFEKNPNEKFFMEKLGVNRECLHILMGGGDAVNYVMVYEQWIAVRSNNIELYGWDDQKRKYLLNGLDEIFDSEGIEEDNPEQMDFTIFDFKTNKSRYITLADIQSTIPVVRPVQQLMTKNHSKFNITNKDNTENTPQTNKSNPSPLNVAAQKIGMIGPGQNLWRGTSEQVAIKGIHA